MLCSPGVQTILALKGCTGNPQLSHPFPGSLQSGGATPPLVSVVPEAHLGSNPYISQGFLIHCFLRKFPEAVGQYGFHCYFYE